MYPELALLIDGEWISAGREMLPVHNPATGELLGSLPVATPDDIDRAAEAADRAFERWRRLSANTRAGIMQAIAALVRQNHIYLARVLTLEQGKTLAESAGEISAAADTFQWMAEESSRIYGRIVPSRHADTEQLVLFEPIGPVAGFAPWNFPAVLSARKIAAALSAGCSIVIKPAEETPGVMVAMARLCVQAGLPSGVLNLLFGRPEDISTRLIASHYIKKISFTGSVPVGRRLSALAGAAMKKITLELGGHAPVIICDGADVARIAPLAVATKFRNAGQFCHCPTRFIIHESVYHDFVRIFSAAANRIRVGNGIDPATEMGPLIDARRVGAMDALCSDAKNKGAEILTGGPGENSLRVGSFWLPTVIANPSLGARLMHEEPFGPIALMMPFRKLADALDIANGVEYGLAAYAFTPLLSEARLLQNEFEAGSVCINTFKSTSVEMPFSGMKSSGLGSEMGIEGLMEYVRVKAVVRA